MFTGVGALTLKIWSLLTSMVMLPQKWIQNPFDLEWECCRKRSMETGLYTVVKVQVGGDAGFSLCGG